MKTEPQAFPTVEQGGDNGQWWSTTEGMTLRDYFAAKAMQAYCKDGISDTGYMNHIAISSYHMAAAMMEERKRYLEPRPFTQPAATEENVDPERCSKCTTILRSDEIKCGVCSVCEIFG